MKNMLRAIPATVLLFLSTDLFACLNLYVIDERGREHVFDSYPPYKINFSRKDALESLRLREKWLVEKKDDDDHYQYVSDYAVHLVMLGRNKEALAILKKLAKQKPKEYEILANLATAYELNGYPDSALKYMKQSLKINPGSHQSSEWFHVRFLEATIKHRDQKISIDQLNILKLDTVSVDKTSFEINHQLAERVPLTSAPNDMLSKVLEESADYYKKHISIDWSAKFYAMAIGFSANEKTKARLWEKLENTRARVVEISKKNNKAARRDEVRRQLLATGWKKYFQADIDRWKAHRAHYEKDLKILLTP